MSMANPSVPTIVSTGLICLVLGAGAGVAVTQAFGPFDFSGKQKDEPTPADPSVDNSSEGKAKRQPMVAGMGGGGGGGEGKGKGKGGFGMGGGMMGGGMGKGGGMMGGGMGKSDLSSTPRYQLANLVTVINKLTDKPLAITLTDDQKAQLAEQLANLDTAESINDADARKRLEAILEILKADRATLESFGIRFPGRDLDKRPTITMPNPFADAKYGKSLTELMSRLSKAKQ